MIQATQSHMLAVACVLLFLASGADASQVSKLRSKEHMHRFVRSLTFHHSLRVCNAYPGSDDLEIFKGRKEKLTGDSPMPYKSCREFKSPLNRDDKLEFKSVDGESVGTFSVTELPDNDAKLLLVIHRHDTLSTAVSFASHVFANLDTPQVAIIDAYTGSARYSARLMDLKDLAKKNGYFEDLRYDSVVAVDPGRYEVDLSDAEGKNVLSKASLVALNKENYVVLRVGVEAELGDSYKSEIMVYPQSNPAMLPSAAYSPRAFLALSLAVATVGIML